MESVRKVDKRIDDSGALLIKFARFVNGTLELFEDRPDSCEYVAFSHVWGDWKWRGIPGIPYEVKASQEKADFIENDLPALVGDGAFWMDTLTVDQHNEKEVLDIVQSIPTIFRMAKRTIAVRECDGLYDCCMEAVRDFQTIKEFKSKLYTHCGAHDEFVCNESYLQRLWTLQECLISHTIQFIVAPNNQPKKTKTGKKAGCPSCRHRIDQAVAGDALRVLAFSFQGSDNPKGIVEFVKAYVHGGTVVNPNRLLRMESEDLHTGRFLQNNFASQRSATMSRDYIFATMPQFPWYKYPMGAADMSFGDIYADLYQQAADNGHAFTCRFTRSMLNPGMVDRVEGWLPSKQQPEPSCLGDFLKLIGHRVPQISNGASQHVHLTAIVEAVEFSDCLGTDPELEVVFAMIEASMEAFWADWHVSHHGGELSKFGHLPSSLWTLDSQDGMKCGWHYNGSQWEMLEAENEVFMNEGSSSEHEETDDSVANVTLFEQTMKILDRMWCLKDQARFLKTRDSKWHFVMDERRRGWCTPLLRTMLLIETMVNSHIPLSAVAWINRNFLPICVTHRGRSVTLGLLAKHARHPKATRALPYRFWSVAQHLPGEVGFGATLTKYLGKDLFLVDPTVRVPVGILPEFIPDDGTNERYETLQALCTGIGAKNIRSKL